MREESEGFILPLQEYVDAAERRHSAREVVQETCPGDQSNVYDNGVGLGQPRLALSVVGCFVMFVKSCNKYGWF